jgi:menaquinol-cytochrome c reductase iron-sulfur subunit
MNEKRRTFLKKLGIGAFLASLSGIIYTFFRPFKPDVLYEPPRRVKIGEPSKYPEGITFIPENRVYIIREGNSFHAISAICTHLGCTVQSAKFAQAKKVVSRGEEITESFEFFCACHGSRYYGDGTNYSGPAPRPLPWFKLYISPEDGQLVVDISQEVERGTKLKV